jgi:hypothetical protein
LFEANPNKHWLILKPLDDDFLGSTMTDQKYSVNPRSAFSIGEIPPDTAEGLLDWRPCGALYLKRPTTSLRDAEHGRFFSDMMNESTGFNMPALLPEGPKKMIERVKANGLVPPAGWIPGVCGWRIPGGVEPAGTESSQDILGALFPRNGGISRFIFGRMQR